MIESYRVLTEQISLELTGLEKAVFRAERAMNTAKNNSGNNDIYLDSVALNLHSFYTILERVFSQIATVVDGIMPSGSEWQRDLLVQMSKPLSDLRPQVISSQTIRLLEEYRSFRQIVRNALILDIETKKVESLVEILLPTFKQVKNELLLFSDFLEKDEVVTIR